MVFAWLTWAAAMSSAALICLKAVTNASWTLDAVDGACMAWMDVIVFPSRSEKVFSSFWNWVFIWSSVQDDESLSAASSGSLALLNGPTAVQRFLPQFVSAEFGVGPVAVGDFAAVVGDFAAVVRGLTAPVVGTTGVVKGPLATFSSSACSL